VSRFVDTDVVLELHVPGQAAHLARRVIDTLKQEARKDFSAAVSRHCAALGVPLAPIRIGDAASRWGSCSTRGGLAFSWRLVLAPPEVLGYLAAHEVAHLREMNHGSAFWAIVARLDPHFRTHRAWLKRHGAGLHAYRPSVSLPGLEPNAS
jgi:predicted metal-dependent hydrolase